ncbi:MAG: hypothetical protein Q9212_003808 [Teloschistes hypoglaucus]
MTDSVDERDGHNGDQKREATLGTRVSPSLHIGKHFLLDKHEDIKRIGSSRRAALETYFYLDNCQHLSKGEKRDFVRKNRNGCLGITELVGGQQEQAEKFANLLHSPQFETEEHVDAGAMEWALKMWEEELKISLLSCDAKAMRKLESLPTTFCHISTKMKESLAMTKEQKRRFFAHREQVLILQRRGAPRPITLTLKPNYETNV